MYGLARNIPKKKVEEVKVDRPGQRVSKPITIVTKKAPKKQEKVKHPSFQPKKKHVSLAESDDEELDIHEIREKYGARTVFKDGKLYINGDLHVPVLDDPEAEVEEGKE